MSNKLQVYYNRPILNKGDREMKRLTPCELAIMQIIWKYKKDMPEAEIKLQLKELGHKGYARTTIATFLKKLEEKGYLEKYHVGRNSYVHALISARAYGQEQLRMILEQYYEGDSAVLIKDVQSVQ